MPTNLYGPRDNFDLTNSHVLPAMMRKMHLAKLLNTGDEAALRADLDRLPVDGIDGSAPMGTITATLAARGITGQALTLWGTGAPLREFLWSEDMADASVHVLLNVGFDDLRGDRPEVRNCHINIGSGKELTIARLADKIRAAVGFKGRIDWDTTKPDGTMRKLCDVSRIHSLGWHHSVEIDDGIARLYRWYLSR
jgi:GDP-L-fucose synthase